MKTLPRLSGIAVIMLLLAVVCGESLPTMAPAPAITEPPVTIVTLAPSTTPIPTPTPTPAVTPSPTSTPTPTPAIIEVTIIGGEPTRTLPVVLGAVRFIRPTNERNCHDLGEWPLGWPDGFSPLGCPVIGSFQVGAVAGVWRWQQIGGDVWGQSDGLGWITWIACLDGDPHVRFYPGLAPADLSDEQTTIPAPLDPCLWTN